MGRINLGLGSIIIFYITTFLRIGLLLVGYILPIIAHMILVKSDKLPKNKLKHEIMIFYWMLFLFNEIFLMNVSFLKA